METKEIKQDVQEIVGNGVEEKVPPKISAPGASASAEPPPPSVEAAPPAPSQQDEFAWRFSELTKKERDLLREKQAMKEQLAEYEAYKKRQELKKQNPYAYLKEEGLDFDALANSAIKENEPESKMAALEKKLEEFERKEKEKAEREHREQEDRQNNELVQRAKTGVADVVKAGLEKYEIINGDEDVLDTLHQVFQTEFASHFEKYQVPFFSMPDDQRKKFIEMCADKVETYYEGKIKKLLGSSKRLGSSLGAQTAKPTPETKSVTLTSSMTASTPAPSTSAKLRSKDEEIRRIANEFKARSETLQR